MTISTAAVATTPLSHLQRIAGNVALSERELCGKVSLRGELEDSAFVAACEKVLGSAPQPTLNKPQQLAAGTLYWIGPSEWLLHCDIDTAAETVLSLQQAAEGAHLSTVDVSDYYVVLRLEGVYAREVLSRGTPLDVHPRSFQQGEAVSTRFAKCSVLLHAHDDSCFDLQVRWSHAEYLWQFIAQAASQYN